MYLQKLEVTVLVACILIYVVESVFSPKNGKMTTGGLSAERPADAAIQKILDSVKSGFETKAVHSFDEFTALKYRSQVVAGTNYFVKVRTAPGKFAHVRIFVPLPHTKQPAAAVTIKEDLTEESPIEYF